MIDQIRGVFPVGMAPAGTIPLEPMSLSIVVALKDSAFSDDTQRVAEALAAKTFLMLRIAKIRAGEAKANAIYDYRLQLAYGGENTILIGCGQRALDTHGSIHADCSPLISQPASDLLLGYVPDTLVPTLSFRS